MKSASRCVKSASNGCDAVLALFSALKWGLRHCVTDLGRNSPPKKDYQTLCCLSEKPHSPDFRDAVTQNANFRLFTSSYVRHKGVAQP